MRHNHHHAPWPLKMTGALILVPGILFLMTWIVWMLWNALVPGLFGLTALTFWQTMGLMVLVKILFSGPKPHGPKLPFRPRYEDRDAWRRHMKERFGPEGRDYHRHGPYGGHGRFDGHGDTAAEAPDSETGGAGADR